MAVVMGGGLCAVDADPFRHHKLSTGEDGQHDHLQLVARPGGDLTFAVFEGVVKVAGDIDASPRIAKVTIVCPNLHRAPRMAHREQVAAQDAVNVLGTSSMVADTSGRGGVDSSRGGGS
jgi:hypothetical protein